MKYFANWKLNLNIEESLDLANKYLQFSINPDDEVIVSPPMFVIDKIRDILGSKYSIYSQDVSKLNGLGGLTGEVTATILKECGFSGSLIGHTERRLKLHETNDDIRSKLLNCLSEGLNVVLSVGEYGEKPFDYSKTINMLSEEFKMILSGLTKEFTSKIIIAYEDTEGVSSLNESPVAVDQNELSKKFEFIKTTLQSDYNFENPTVLYGGSVNPDNISSLKSVKNIDGFVIGKASLDPSQMQEIISKTI